MNRKHALIAGVAALLAAVGVASGLHGPSNADRLHTARTSAFYACQDFARQQLKAPATARFEDYNDFEVTGSDPTGEFTVVSGVDSENSFGALLHSTFTCQVMADRSRWTLLELTGLG